MFGTRRTAYSAAFVAAGALGMAFGPALSAVLIVADFTLAGVEFNGLTNPGWIMFVLWVVMGALIQYEFQVGAAAGGGGLAGCCW